MARTSPTTPCLTQRTPWVESGERRSSHTVFVVRSCCAGWREPQSASAASSGKVGQCRGGEDSRTTPSTSLTPSSSGLLTEAEGWPQLSLIISSTFTPGMYVNQTFLFNNFSPTILSVIWASVHQSPMEWLLCFWTTLLSTQRREIAFGCVQTPGSLGIKQIFGFFTNKSIKVCFLLTPVISTLTELFDFRRTRRCWSYF